MAHIIKSFKVEWNWSGDEHALLGFNVAITPDGSNPHEDVVALSQTGKENFYHIFRKIIVEKDTPHTAWVQALYKDKDSEWESVSGFVVDDDDKATITTKDQHDKIVDETINYRTTGAPDSNPTPTNILIDDNPNGTLDIELQWAAYTQGSLKADMIFLFWRKSGSNITEAISVNDNSEIFNVNTEAASRYTFEGVPPNKFYSFGLAAGRRTELGIEISTIQIPEEWTNIDVGYASINHDEINASAGNGAVKLTDQGLIGKKEDGTVTLWVDSLGNAHFNGVLTVGDVPTDTDDLETQEGAQEKANGALISSKDYTDENSLPDSIASGGTLRADLIPNGTNEVEVDISPLNYTFIHPNGMEVNQTAVDFIGTDLEGSKTGWYYLVYVAFDLTRFGNLSYEKSIIPARMDDGQWKYYDNNGNGFNFEPNKNDCIVAKIIKKDSTSAGIEELVRFVSKNTETESGAEKKAKEAEAAAALYTDSEISTRAKPLGAKLWHLDEHFTSTQGDKITIITI